MDEPTLILECWEEDLNEAQLASYQKAEAEQAAISGKLKDLMKKQSGEELFIGEVFSAYQFRGSVKDIDDSYVVKSVPKPPKSKKVSFGGVHKREIERKQQDSPPPSRGTKRRAAIAASTNVILDDDDDDIPLARRIGRKDRDYEPPAKSSKSSSSASPATSKGSDKKGKSTSKSTASAEKEKVVTPFRPQESTSIGGLTIGTKKDEKGSESKDNAKLQGKTFPSLVVVAKPHLKVKEATANSANERSALDSKVKVVLMLTPAKFTEWLIQQGLLKSEQRCDNHPNSELKLGVYSDGTKFPYSGGYVWISECCPTRFVSVFHGSLFEGAQHPPSNILKLIYHWACQTNIQNVVQWVKVDNLYIKGIYTWLRAVCSLALSKHLKTMGGPGKYVEVGVISLGTTAQDGQQRQVKVEVLGVLDPTTNVVRLRAIEPFNDADRSYKKRFARILEPLSEWVSKESIITIDLTVDKTTLNALGYKYVLQVAANDATAKRTNATIMDYLRRIVPRMFQNTLSLLSRQMIQQFLDELVWREQFGTYPLQAFDNITTHLAEQTRLDTKETLTQRLYQVATNPFKDWKTFEMRERKGGSKTPKKTSNQIIAKAAKIPVPTSPMSSRKDTSTPPSKKGASTPQQKKQSTPASKLAAPASKTSSSKSAAPAKGSTPAKGTPAKAAAAPAAPAVETRGLEEIYYGKTKEDENMLYNIEKINNPDDSIEVEFQCPCCDENSKSNIQLQSDLLSHINTDSNREDYKHQCQFCLEKLPSERGISRHEGLMHPSSTKNASSVSYYCLICHVRFNTIQLLAAHLQKNHVPLELPYMCNACGYRSSCHHDIIDHFYKSHENENMLQCPLCLSVCWVYSKGQVLFENISRFFSHVQQHFEKSNNKKCNRCVLTFITRGELKYHLMKDHGSFKNNKTVTELLPSSAKIPIPKSKGAPKLTLAYKTLSEYPELTLDLTGGKLCLECDRDLDEGGHIRGLYKCQKCEYKSCCLRAVLEHTSACPTALSAETSGTIPLEKEMHCVCGFSCSEGNTMAKHLVICEHKSAYPSVEVAQENTVKRNMLDMLGLVRREGEGSESTQNETAATVATEGEENDSSTVANAVDDSNIADDSNVVDDATVAAAIASTTDETSEVPETESIPELEESHEPETEPERESIPENDDVQTERLPDLSQLDTGDDVNQFASIQQEQLQQTSFDDIIQEDGGDSVQEHYSMDIQYQIQQPMDEDGFN